MDNAIYKEVRALVAKYRSIKEDRLSEDTDIFKLGMDGDDAREFMEVFAKEFGVDMSEFEFSKHFGPEGFNPVSFLYCLLFARERLRRLPITLGDLTEAAKTKKWLKR